jgi:hypothetical protein
VGIGDEDHGSHSFQENTMTRFSMLLHFVLLAVVALLVCGAAQSHPPLPPPTQFVVLDNSTALSGDTRPENDATVMMAFRTRSSFKSDEEYGQYVQKTLRVGCRVRASVDYESVTNGMMGTYLGTNGNQPPCLILWDKNINSSSALLPNVPADKHSHVYWVYWHQIDILSMP